MDHDDSIRMRVVGELERLIGPEAALYNMSNLPIVNWHELATKEDLEAIRAEMATKADLRVLNAEWHGEFASLRTEFATLRADSATEFASVRTELATLRGDMHQAIAAQTRWFVATNVALLGVCLAAARLMF